MPVMVPRSLWANADTQTTAIVMSCNNCFKITPVRFSSEKISQISERALTITPKQYGKSGAGRWGGRVQDEIAAQDHRGLGWVTNLCQV